jgi:hypothetical protein
LDQKDLFRYARDLRHTSIQTALPFPTRCWDKRNSTLRPWQYRAEQREVGDPCQLLCWDRSSDLNRQSRC